MANTLKVPVKPYVARYLNLVFSHCLKLSKRNSIGVLLFYLLHRNKEKKQYDEYLKHYTDHIIISISHNHCFELGARELSSFSIVHFNTFVEDIFKLEFHKYVDQAQDFGVGPKEAIERFMEKYQLSDSDISFDTLKKSYQRYLLKEEERLYKKSLAVLSPAR